MLLPTPAAFGPLGLLTLLASVLPGAPRVSTSGLSDEVGDRMELRTERKPSFAVLSEAVLRVAATEVLTSQAL